MAISWLDDCNDSSSTPQDAIPLAAAEYLGTERATQLAQQAEIAGDWWLASLRWSALASVVRINVGHHQSVALFKRCASALQKYKPVTSEDQIAKQRIEIPALALILTAWNPDDAPVYGSRLKLLEDCAAAKENVELGAAIFKLTYWYQIFCSRTQRHGTEKELLFGRYAYKYLRLWAVAAQNIHQARSFTVFVFGLYFSLRLGFLDRNAGFRHQQHEVLEMFDWDTAWRQWQLAARNYLSV